MAARARLAIVTPVFNDWTSFSTLVIAIDALVESFDADVTIVAVDDGSTEKRPDLARAEHIAAIEIITLACNLGHQRAIAVGLCDVAARASFDAALVLDSDGEDRPDAIAGLLRAREANPNAVIVASRSKRSEGFVFRSFYVVYKRAFAALTGKTIDFGNFTLLPKTALARVVFMSELWNNLAAALVRSRLPIVRVPTSRGTRYAGRSQMGFIGLVVHGLGAISVFADVLFVRALIAFGVAAMASLAIAIATIVFRACVPEWSMTVSWIVFAVLATGAIASAACAFVTLANRSARAFVPATNARAFVRERTTL